MCSGESHGSQAGRPLGPEDFRDPIVFFYGEHERLRRHCENLVRLAKEPAAAEAPEIAAAILDFLEDDLPLHRADEEEDLFPMLEQRSPVPPPGSHDELLSSLEVLRREHEDDIEQGQSLVPTLHAIAAGEAPRDPEMFRHYVRAFVQLQRGHQAMENRVVLPAAIERLPPEDMAELARRMAARRGLLFAG